MSGIFRRRPEISFYFLRDAGCELLRKWWRRWLPFSVGNGFDTTAGSGGEIDGRRVGTAIEKTRVELLGLRVKRVWRVEGVERMAR